MLLREELEPHVGGVGLDDPGVVLVVVLAGEGLTVGPRGVPLAPQHAVVEPEDAPAESLHGGDVMADEQQRAAGLAEGVEVRQALVYEEHVADREGFLTAYPDGINGGFNAFVCCGDADDVGFLKALTERLVREWNVDPDRVYLAGISNGGDLGFRAAVEAPGVFAAIGVVSGGFIGERPARATYAPTSAPAISEFVSIRTYCIGETIIPASALRAARLRKNVRRGRDILSTCRWTSSQRSSPIHISLPSTTCSPSRLRKLPRARCQGSL